MKTSRVAALAAAILLLITLSACIPGLWIDRRMRSSIVKGNKRKT